MKFRVGDTVNVYVGEEFTPGCSGVVQHAMKDGESIIYQLVDSLTWWPEAQLKRKYTHISPSGLSLFDKDVQEFYMKYVARYKPPSIPQTRPMSIGSAFDAYTKSHIIDTLKKNTDERYQFESLFKAQVEEHNRETGKVHGLHAFEQYKQSGALADIMLEIVQGDIEPKFEFDVKDYVKHSDGHVPLAGKPDMFYKNKHGHFVINDWKVNGYYGKSNTSPKPGYVMCRDGWVTGNRSKNHRCAHKDAQIVNVGGVLVNMACKMEDIDRDWATQLATYAWLMGCEIGSDFIAGIEQLACSYGESDGKPNIRVASFRCKISKDFQFEVYQRYLKCYRALSSGIFFPELDRLQNDMKCLEMEKMAQTLNPTGDANEDWFNNMNRGHRNF